MGSGKSTVGQRLSTLSGYPLIDTDTLIESNQQQSIRSIFQQHGEPYFRQIEHHICSTLSQYPPTIISTGGGIVENNQNIRHLKSIGTLYYLYCTLSTIRSRLPNDHTRPLFKSNNSDLFHYRHSIYTTISEQTIDTNNQSPDIIASQIWKIHQTHYQ